MPSRKRHFSIAVLAVAIITQNICALGSTRGATTRPATPPQSDAERLARLDKRLEELREALKIPGLSAAVVKDQKVLWAKGFGYADVENKIPATEHTPFHLASLTKTFASTVLMRLVQDGKIKLDDPVSKYGVTLESEGVIRVKHLLSHTSEGNPGENYRYNGNRYGELDKVVTKATGKSFAELLIENILDPLAMTETAANVPPTVKWSAPPTEADRKSIEEITAVFNDFIGGYNSGDTARIEKYIAPRNSGFQSGGGSLYPLADTDQLRDLFRRNFKLSLQVSELEVTPLGDSAAVVTSVVTEIVTPPNGAPERENLRTSFVLNKQGGAWKFVHAHHSVMTEAPIIEKQRQRFDTVRKTLAQPYGLDDKFNVVRIKYPTHFSTSAGLMASVLDMAKYDIAVDQNKFLTRETQQLAFTPTVSTKGQPLPYGLGWFTQDYRGTRFIWHYGYWTGNSSLILKVPDRNLTFIVMANTDNLSRPTDLGSGDVMTSHVALAFLKAFILPEHFGEPLPDINWAATAPEVEKQLKQSAGKPYADILTKELLTQTRIHGSVGRREDALRLLKVYSDAFTKPLPDGLAQKTPLAQIVRAADMDDKTVEFTLAREQGVRVFAVGEGTGGEMFDYGWIENAETGQSVWQMKVGETTHAGGAEKNRKADTVVTLPAGRYKLRYKADDSHSFDNWNSLPPEFNFWGIALYAK